MGDISFSRRAARRVGERWQHWNNAQITPVGTKAQSNGPRTKCWTAYRFGEGDTGVECHVEASHITAPGVRSAVGPLGDNAHRN